MKLEKIRKKGKTKKPRKPGNQPAAARSSPTTPSGTPPAAETRRRKQSPTVTPKELEEADRYLSGLWNIPKSGWRNRLQGLTVQTRKNWVNG